MGFRRRPLQILPDQAGTRQELENNGTPHDMVARIMVDALSGHDLLASAPSWDGKWLSTILRAAGFHRHSLRLRRSDDAYRGRSIGRRV